MHALRGSAIGLLMAVAAARAQSAPAPAPFSYKPCALVSKADAALLTGQTVTGTTQNDVPYKKDKKHDHDGVLSTCGYTYAPGKGLSIVISSVPVTAEGKAAGKAAAKKAEDQVKKLGAKVDEKKFGDMTCSTVDMTGDMAAFSSTNCGQEKGSLFFVMTVSKGPNGFVSMDQLHTLAMKLMAQLP